MSRISSRSSLTSLLAVAVLTGGLIALAHPLLAGSAPPPPGIAPRVPLRRFVLKCGGKPVQVPEDRVWEIRGLLPAEELGPIGTADLYIDGEAALGAGVAVAGRFDITLSGRQGSPLRISPRSKVEVGDSRGRVLICEFSHSGADERD